MRKGYDLFITYDTFTMIVFLAKKDDTGRVDRTQWKAMVNTMSDTTKFVDMLHNVSWEDGLPEDVLRGKDVTLSVKFPSSKNI